LFRGDCHAVVLLACTVGGCMHIYPDPELPDIKVEWYTEDACQAASDRVTVSLATRDPAAEVATVTVPCAEAVTHFVDVARERYVVTGALEAEDGTVLTIFTEEIDLRDGLNERVFGFFGRSYGPFVTAAWTFDQGASCATLGATDVSLELAPVDQSTLYSISERCEAGMIMTTLSLQGTFTVTARALADSGTVAVSTTSAPFSFEAGKVVHLGTFTLSPCGDACGF